MAKLKEQCVEQSRIKSELMGAAGVVTGHMFLKLGMLSVMLIGAYLIVGNSVSIFVFLLFLFYYSIPLITKLGSMTANALPIPLTLIYSPMAITACFSIIIVISDILDEIKKNWRKEGGVEQ